MIKLSAIAAAFAVSAIAAAPASAMDLQLSANATNVIHVSLAGKSPAQISADVKVAARTVCQGSPYEGCIWAALSDAHHQLTAIRRVETAMRDSQARLAENAPPHQVGSN